MRVLLTLVAACFVSGCSFHWPRSAAARPVSEPDIQVAEEANDGRYLYILAKIDLPVELTNSQRVVAEAIGLHSGEVLVAEKKAVSPAFRSHEEPDFQYLVPFKLPTEGLTDYQLKLAWGEDAKPVVSGQQLTAALELEGFTEPSSDNELVGSLKNTGTETVNKVVLLIEYGPLDSTRGVPQNAELLDLVGLGLKPGTSKRLSIKVPAGQKAKLSISDAA